MGFFSKMKERTAQLRDWQARNRERRLEKMKEDKEYYRQAAAMQREKSRYQKLKGQTRNPFMELLGSPNTSSRSTNSGIGQTMWGPPHAPIRRKRRRRRLQYVIVRR